MPAEWLGRWNLDPLLLALLTGALAYAWLKKDEASDRLPFAAIGLVAFLFVSPFCALGSALLSARVVHHLFLATVLAPILATIARNRRATEAPLVSLPLATVIHALTFWAWHLPGLYAAALSSDALFWAMQLTMTGGAAVFWLAVLRAPAMAAVAGLLATMIQMGVLGALITFSSRPLYAPHWPTTEAWGLSAIEDQQLAGLIMWAPGSALYLLAALAILYRTMRPRQPA